MNKIRFQGIDIAVIDRSGSLSLKDVKKFSGDICDYSFVENVVSDFKPDRVFHLAGYKNRSSNVKEVSMSLQVNLLGTLNLYQALTTVGSVKSVVSLGTTDEYGIANTPFHETLIESPNSPYGFSKVCASQLALFFNRTFDLPVVILRPTIAYGPFQGDEMFIPSLINTLIANKDFKMTKGNQLRDFIYISDLVDAMLLAGETPNLSGEIFNIGFGESLKLRDVAFEIASVLNKRHCLKLGRIPYRANEVMNYSTCIKKLVEKTGWRPKIDFKKGIDATIEYYKNNA